MATVMLILGALHYLPESKAIQGTAEFFHSQNHCRE